MEDIIRKIQFIFEESPAPESYELFFEHVQDLTYKQQLKVLKHLDCSSLWSEQDRLMLRMSPFLKLWRYDYCLDPCDSSLRQFLLFYFHEGHFWYYFLEIDASFYDSSRRIEWGSVKVVSQNEVKLERLYIMDTKTFDDGQQDWKEEVHSFPRDLVSTACTFRHIQSSDFCVCVPDTEVWDIYDFDEAEIKGYYDGSGPTEISEYSSVDEEYTELLPKGLQCYSMYKQDLAERESFSSESMKVLFDSDS